MHGGGVQNSFEVCVCNVMEIYRPVKNYHKIYVSVTYDNLCTNGNI
jgi:hypothetical protein